MSWLRLVSISTFAKLNPEWEIRLIRSSPEIRGRGYGYAHEADYTWWTTLAEHGGFQVATDIVFVRPIPEEWTQGELAAVSNVDVVVSFPMLGCAPMHPYMVGAAARCRQILSEKPHGDASTDYQEFGYNLLQSLGNCGEHFPIPMASLCPIMWDDTERLWLWEMPDIELGPDVIGVHWFGGSDGGKRYENGQIGMSVPPIVRLAMRLQ